MLGLLQTVLARSVRPGQEFAEPLGQDVKELQMQPTDAITKPTPTAGNDLDLNAAAPEGSLSERWQKALVTLGSGPVDGLLQDLVSIAGQIASVDAVLRQAGAAEHAGGEAEKWKAVAKQTAAWTRGAFAERQRQCLERIKDAVDPKSVKPAAPEEKGPQVEATAQPWRPRSATPPTTPVAGAAGGPRGRGTEIGAGWLKRSGVSEGDGSMKKGLEALRDYDAGRVLIVRKIKKLGFESPAHLKKYFSQYGDVSEVHVATSMMKPSAKRPAGRVRPAALGFVVMAAEADAAAVLAQGPNHTVGAAVIEVKAFEPFGDYSDES